MFQLTIDNMNFGVYQCGPEWIVKEKGSIFHRLYYVYDGVAEYSDGYRCFPLLKDHLYLFKINKPYSITHDSQQPFKCLYFHIMISPLLLSDTLCIDTRSYPEIYHMIKALEYVVEDKSKYDREFIQKLLDSLFFLMEKKVEFMFLKDERLRDILQYIHENYNKNISNTQLSSILSFNRYHFIRLFKRALGDTPRNYISKYRLSKAVSLLHDNIPVKEITGIVGFEDSKAFSRAFKNCYGYSPKEYKKSHLMKP